MTHLIADLLLAAARGDHLPADGAWRRTEPWRDGLEAVVAFTGHGVLAVDPRVPDAQFDGVCVDGQGGAGDPNVVAALAGPGGWIDSLDLLMGIRPPATASTPLVPREDLGDHPRAAFARAVRDDVVVYGSPDRAYADLAVVARGVGGLPELSFALAPDRRGHGNSVALVRAALDVCGGQELVLAAAAPGNAASVRALLRAGFTPLGSVQLFRPNR